MLFNHDADERSPLMHRFTELEAAYRQSEAARLQAERSLHDAQQLINGIATLSPDIVYVFDCLGQQNVWCSSELYTVLGYEPEHFQAQGSGFIATLIHPDELPLVQAHWARLATAQDDQVYETSYRIRHANGEWRSLHSRERVLSRTSTGAVQQVVGIAQDITQHQQLEHRERTSQQILQFVLDTLPQRVFWKDCQHRYLGSNRHFAEDAGFANAADLVGKSDDDLHWRQFAEVYRTQDRYVLQHNQPQINVDDRVVLPDGTPRWIRVSKLPLRDAQGQVIGIFGAYEDVTERRQAEEALRQSQEMLQLVIDTLPQRILWKDRQSVYLGCNRQHALAIGFEHPQELIGKSDHDLHWGETLAARYIKDDLRVMQADRPQHHMLETQPLADGEIRWLDTNKIPLHDAEGEVSGILIAIEDVTERKQAELLLQQSAEQMQQQAQREQLHNQLTSQIRQSLDVSCILETTVREIRAALHLDQCLFSWYRQDGREPHFEVVQESVGTETSSILGLCFLSQHATPITTAVEQQQMICLADTQAIDDAVARNFYQSLGYEALLALPVCTQSGAIGLLSCVCTQMPRPWQDDEVELVQSVVDQLAIALNQAELYEQSRAQTSDLQAALQQLQRTQAQLIQSEKMSSLGQLVAGVAHEINNPVNFIYGNLNYARDYTQDLLTLITLYQQHHPQPHAAIQILMQEIDLDFLIDDLPKLLNSMQVGAERIQQIVASLRNFSRMDEAEFKTVNLHEGIDSTLMILQNRIKARSNQPGVDIVQNYGELPQVECYPGELNQVFMNILSNALDALEEHNAERSPADSQTPPSRIQIQTEFKRNPSSDPGDGHIVIQFQDNGPGIPAAVQQRLFDPFFTTKSVGKGTGMGLSISYQIVTERHGGTLECHSQPGQGATFVVTIPVRQR
jgi:PAS domain S-box-containing protein